MKELKAIVITGYGINCDKETRDVLDYVGFFVEIVHINDLIKKKRRFLDYHLIVFPGGFSYGDDLGSGKAFAAMIKNHLWDEIIEFKNKQGVAIGICNGFQIMAHLGLFEDEVGKQNSALLFNDSARYICKWVKIEVNQDSPCIFTKNIKTLNIPIAHGEGKFYINNRGFKSLNKNNQIVMKYIQNPNGSTKDIAGICDKSGRFFGLMPHPERAVFFHHLPQYHKLKEQLTREGKKKPVESDCIQIFKNALLYLKKRT